VYPHHSLDLSPVKFTSSLASVLINKEQAKLAEKMEDLNILVQTMDGGK
jgi:hypothetical protein